MVIAGLLASTAITPIPGGDAGVPPGPAVEVRRARSPDTDALLSIGAGGAGPDRRRRGRLDAWLDDPNGVLLVAEDGGHVIGTARVVHHGSGAWWLHGVRVADRARRRGVASALWRTAIDMSEACQAAAGGPGVLHLCCDLGNVAGHRMADSSGCTAVGEFTRLVAATDRSCRATTGTFHRATDHDRAALCGLLDGDPELRMRDRLLFGRPVVGKVITDDRLRHLVSTASVHTWSPPGLGRDPVAVVVHDAARDAAGRVPRELVVGALVAPGELLSVFAADVVRLARRLGRRTLSAFVASERHRIAALGAAGWLPLPDNRGRGTIYRRPLAGGR